MLTFRSFGYQNHTKNEKNQNKTEEQIKNGKKCCTKLFKIRLKKIAVIWRSLSLTNQESINAITIAMTILFPVAQLSQCAQAKKKRAGVCVRAVFASRGKVIYSDYYRGDLWFSSLVDRRCMQKNPSPTKVNAKCVMDLWRTTSSFSLEIQSIRLSTRVFFVPTHRNSTRQISSSFVYEKQEKN